MRRIFVVVGRGTTDKTATCVFPWEKAILERIHGGSVEEVSIDEMCNLKGAVKVQKNTSYKRPGLPDGEKVDVPPNLRQQLEAMVTVPPENDPSADPDTEYNRLVDKYGADHEVKMPVVTFVYGPINSGQFQKAVADAVERSKEDEKAAARAKAKPGKSPADMSLAELKKALKDEGIDFDPRAGQKVLADMLATATA